MKKVVLYLNKLYILMSKKEMRILPGHLAYFLVMSIMPLLTLISLIVSSLNLSLDDITKFLFQFMPNEISNIILPLFENNNMSFNFVMMIVGFYMVSNGMAALILVSNTLYENEPKDIIFRRIKALFLTFVLINTFLFILVVLGFGNTIVKFLLNLNPFTDIEDNLYKLFIYLKYPTAFIIIFIFIKLIYTLTPDKKIPSKTVNKGALFTTVSWILETTVYSYYANNIANYDLFYGSLSNLIVLLIWIYIISYTLVIGFAINVNEYHSLEKKV